MTRNVVFDLDGVLLDTEPLYTLATQEIVGRHGKVFDWSVKGDMIGRGQLDGAQYLVRALDLPMSAEEYLRQRQPRLVELFPSVAPVEGAEALIRRLQSHGVRLALATSGERDLTDLKLARHPWFSAFEIVVCGDDPGVAPKPAPDLFLAAARGLGVDPRACVVVEDSLAGVQAAQAAGMRCVALPDPNMDATRYGAADQVVSRLSEVGDWLLGAR